jgi:hypothetical protein
MAIQIRAEKFAHAQKVARRAPKTKSWIVIKTLPVADGKSREHTRIMDLSQLGKIDQNFLWASCIWGAIASGYMIYGWRQRSLISFFGGLVMTAMSFVGPNALVMSIVCLAAMLAVWWLLRQGY